MTGRSEGPARTHPAGDEWEARVARVWAEAGDIEETEVLARIEALAGERPDDDATALFERAAANDFVGREGDAEPLYRAALAAGLDSNRHTRALIQLASTLRNLGRADEGLDLLRTDGVDWGTRVDVRAAFEALCLVDSGRPNEAVQQALMALVPHLVEYRRAIDYYARELPSDS